MGECPHFLDPEAQQWCGTCKHGVESPGFQVTPKLPKPRRKEKATKVAPLDPAEQYLQEFLSGARCMICDDLRTGPAFQCKHERAEILAKNIAEIEAFAEAHPDQKGKLVSSAASSALSRATLRAGLRNAPSPIDGLSMGGLIGVANRVGNGRAMEWKSGFKSGDELPV